MFQSKACRDRLCATSRAGHFLAPKTSSFLGTKRERQIEYLRYSSMRVLCHLCGVSYLYCLPSPVLSGRSPVVLSPVSSVLLTSTLVLSPLCCIPPTYVSRLSSGVSCPSTIYYESCGDIARRRRRWAKRPLMPQPAEDSNGRWQLEVRFQVRGQQLRTPYHRVVGLTVWDSYLPASAQSFHLGKAGGASDGVGFLGAACLRFWQLENPHTVSWSFSLPMHDESPWRGG